MSYIATVIKSGWIAGVLLTGVTSFGRAQSFTRSFAGSLLVLKSGDTLRGPLTYLPEQEMVIVTMPDLTRKAFTPAALRAFVVKGEISGYSLAGKSLSKLAEADTRAGSLAALYSNPTSPVLASYLEKGRNQVFITHQLPVQQIQRRRRTTGFFEVLTPGNIMLLQREVEDVLSKEHVSYGRQEPPWAYNITYSERSPPAIRRTLETRKILKPLLYLSLPDHELVLLRSPRKDILSLFPAQQEHVVAFVASRQLSWEKPADIAQIITHLNSLQ